MEFDELLAQVIALLQRQGRVSYGALKRRFSLDDAYLEDLKVELIEAQGLAADEQGRILVWLGSPAAAPQPTAPSVRDAAGAPLTYMPPYLTEKILASRASLEGERKQVTVFFADIKDSTRLIEGLDPEAAQQLLDPAIHLMMDAVHRFEGTVNRVLGDGIMALFGAPIAHEDHALRACYAALALQSAVRPYAEEVRRQQGMILQLRIGLNSGEVVVRAIGNDLHMDYSAVGQHTHLAARLEQLATPGSILLTAATLRLVEGLVRVKALGPMPVKGLTEAVEVCELVGVSGLRRRLQAGVARGLTQFVGRQHELNALYQALEHAGAGHGQVVAVVGEAGVGKSRLVYECVHSHRTQGWLVLESATVSYGKATPYFPIIDLLKRYVHIEDTDAPRTMRAKVTGQLLTLNYRPEYQHGWGSKTYYTQLRLDPLPPARADELLHALLSDDPSLAPLKQLLIARTEGNPFFLEESARTLVETEVLGGEPGAYRLAPHVGAAPRGRPEVGYDRGVPLPIDLQIPATVQAMLAARIDRLPAEEKRLLQTAAVIGTEVPLPLLEAIAELPEAVLHGGLAHLQAAEFLYETRLFPDLEYTFKHTLTHEVAYGSLLHERRRVLHARIVDALEALGGERVGEQVERLAHHALRGEVWEKAVAYCRQAGEKALARSAYREAVGYFEQALRALSYLPEQRDTLEQAIDLRLALRATLRPVGDMRRYLATLREAEALAEAINDPHRLGQVSVFLTNQLRLMSAYDQAIAAAQRALALATAVGDVGVHAMANQYLGFTYHDRGDYRRAIDCLGQTVVALDDLGHRERFGAVFLPAVLSRAILAACHAELGTFAEGRALGAEGLRIAEAIAHPPSLMVASWGIGLLALRQGNLSRALPLLERAVGISQDADIPTYFPWIAAVLGAAYTLAERVADAVSLLTQAMEQSVAEENVSFQALCHLPLSEAQLLAGRLAEAQALAEHTLALAREHQERGHQAYALRLLGDIAARREPSGSTQAEALYQQALALADELGMRPLTAHCHLSLGTLFATTGQREQARVALTAAIDLYRAMDMTFWLSQAEAAMAQVRGAEAPERGGH